MVFSKKIKNKIGCMSTVGLILLSINNTSVTFGAEKKSFREGRYTIVLKDFPAATYAGGVKGIPATAGSMSKRFNINSANAASYIKHLNKTQQEIASKVGVNIIASQSIVLNSFTADLSAQQAYDLNSMPEVKRVEKDVAHKIPDSPIYIGSIYPLVFPYLPGEYLGLDGKNGLWKKLFGNAKKAGGGIVVGAIDTGINPNSESFSGEKLTTTPKENKPYLQNNKILYKKANGQTFTGTCQIGQGFTSDSCNTKLIGAQGFFESFKKTLIEQGRRYKYDSPRDGNGHGSHTASTMAGNYKIPVSHPEGPIVDGGFISGIAPGAKVSSYKIGLTYYDENWQRWFAGGGFTSDILQAFEAAVRDGVDVVNLSIGLGSDIYDSVSEAIFNISAAGIFVSTAVAINRPALRRFKANFDCLIFCKPIFCCGIEDTFDNSAFTHIPF